MGKLRQLGSCQPGGCALEASPNSFCFRARVQTTQVKTDVPTIHSQHRFTSYPSFDAKKDLKFKYYA